MSEVFVSLGMQQKGQELLPVHWHVTVTGASFIAACRPWPKPLA
jgi:hypothetical protein